MGKMTIKIKKLSPAARLPVYGSDFSAGADLCACTDGDVPVAPGETVMIPSGLAIELPAGYVGLVYARSGLASKKGLAPANKVGVIDADYRGEIIIALHNHSAVPAVVSPGDRVAQLLITPVARAEFIEADSLSATIRADGGFGSTGQN